MLSIVKDYGRLKLENLLTYKVSSENATEKRNNLSGNNNCK